MAQSPTSPLVRLVVPLVLALMLGGLAYLLFRPSSKPAATPTPPTPSATGSAPGGLAKTELKDAPPSLGTLSTKPQGSGGAFASIGGLKKDATDKDYLLQIDFNSLGAGIGKLQLGAHRQSIEPDSPPEVLQETLTQPESNLSVVPFGMIEVSVNGQVVPLASRSAWREVAPGAFEAEVVNETGAAVLTINRTFRLEPGRYDLVLEQTFTNRTDKPIELRWAQFGSVDLPIGIIRYGGDPRRTRVGYVPSIADSASGERVHGRELIGPHQGALGKAGILNNAWVFPDHVLWPTADSAEKKQNLSWFGLQNRFFAVTAESLPGKQPQRTDANPPVIDKRLNTIEKVDRVVLTRGLDSDGRPEKNAAMALRAVSPLVTLAPGEKKDASMGIYAGPVRKKELELIPPPSVSLNELEVYSFGSCTLCTFQPVAYFLRTVLTGLKSYVTFDWALAIILLVFCVKLVLHPITKWSQTSLQRFGKQMQKLAPKQKVLQEKFKDDPKRLREEMGRLMKEENVNYAGALGCLPMLMQTPIWIALSSLFFFFFDLRHTPAFFGIVQTVTGHSWHFLADLSEPDRFITLPWHFDAPVMGRIDSINILPIILGVVFFIQQKYLTPPPTTPQSPEMEMQMKIMKFMMVFMFPVMMYNAPSGLALYFITNSTLGIIESRLIRRKLEIEDAKREEELKKNPKAAKYAKIEAPTTFIGRFLKRLAEARAKAEYLKQLREMEKKGIKPGMPQRPNYPPGHRR